MSTIWQTVAGRGDPVDGEPAQFRVIEDDFRRIKDRMFELDGDFDAIRSGTSGDFQGEAADAFREKLNLIATAVGEVPLIAGQLQQTFRHHRVELERLQKRVDSAVARAQTNWDEKRNADADHANSTQRLSFVDQQIDWLESQGDTFDEGDKAYWTSERIEAQNWVSSSRTRVHRADDRLEDSRQDWRNLHDDEEQLDEATAAALRGIQLWSLADPSFLEQITDAFADLYEAFEDFKEYIFSMDFVEDLYKIVDALLTIVSFLSLVLGALAVVFPVLLPLAGAALLISKVLLVAKVGLGLALVCDGRMGAAEWALDTTLSVVALAAGSAVSKSGSGFKFLSSHTSVQTHAMIHHGAKLVDTGNKLAEVVVVPTQLLGLEPFDPHWNDRDHASSISRASAHVSAVPSRFDFDPPSALLRSSPLVPVQTLPIVWAKQ